MKRRLTSQLRSQRNGGLALLLVCFAAVAGGDAAGGGRIGGSAERFGCSVGQTESAI